MSEETEDMPLGGIIIKSGSTTENKTGGWRTFKPIVDPAKCVKCGICEKFCPEGIIDIDPEKGAIMNYDYCKGCGICAHECPTKAITMILEKK